MLIGIVGRARHGKNTVAEEICNFSRASGLVAEIFETSNLVLESLKKEGRISQNASRDNLTPEQIKLLVKHGKEKRDLFSDYWIHRLLKEIVLSKADIIVVPNIRFINEAREIKENRGILIRVTSVVEDGVEFISTDRDPNDVMETENKKIQADYFLTVKRGETELLRKQAAGLANYLLGK
jgi:hypothetical protein